MAHACILLGATPAVGPRTIGLIVALAVLGAAALFLLLPRPRRYALVGGVLLGLVALVLAGFLAGPTSFTPESFLFYVFSAIAVASGCLLVTQRNPARAALSFALVVLSTCGLFLLLAAPFLMAATIIVYGGAIIVTFLFVLMLAQQEGPSDADYRSYEPLLACIGGFVLLGVLLYVLADTYSPATAEALDGRLEQMAPVVERTDPARAAGMQGAEATGTLNEADGRLTDLHDWLTSLADRPGAEEKGQILPKGGKPLDDAVLNAQVVVRGEKRHAQDGQPVDWARAHDALAQVQTAGRDLRGGVGMAPPPAERPLSDYSGPAANVPPGEVRRDAAGRPALPAENVAYLGRSLFTDYLLAVELGGTLLLVATIGAIAIATRRAERLP